MSWLFVTPRIGAHQAPPFMGFSKWEHWSELPFPSPGVTKGWTRLRDFHFHFQICPFLGNPLTLLMGMQTSTAAMENSVEIS